MPAPQDLAARLARCVELFRDPSAKEEQKSEFRALLGLLGGDDLHLHEHHGELSVNGAPVDGAPAKQLVQRLGLHNVTDIHVSRHATPAEVFELLRALADQPTFDDMAARLAAAGAGGITVTSAGAVSPPDIPLPPSEGFGTEGILRGSPMTDIVSGAAVDVPPITRDLDIPPSETARRSMALPDAASGKAPGSDSAGAFLRELERDAGKPSAADRLAELTRDVEEALRTRRPERALAITAAIARNEAQVPENARRTYGIALRRICSKPLLLEAAHLVAAPAHRADAIIVLQRGGPDAVEILLDTLASSSVVGERRAVFDALRQMNEGKDQIVRMLTHEKWFVVRNVAELAGELGLEEAVPALSKHLEHDDERVRKAAAVALSKLDGGAGPLRKALRDPSPDVRMQVAMGVGGRRSSVLAMPLVVALGEEADESVQRELLFALGRIGSAAAVQALIKAAQPGRLFGRKPTALRLAAVEGLRIAGTPAALGTLEGMSDDGDKEVKAAAQAAVAALKQDSRRG